MNVEHWKTGFINLMHATSPTGRGPVYPDAEALREECVLQASKATRLIARALLQKEATSLVTPVEINHEVASLQQNPTTFALITAETEKLFHKFAPTMIGKLPNTDATHAPQ